MDALKGPLRDAQLAIHAALAAVMAWFAVVLAIPGSTFSTGVSYRAMAQLATEESWAMACWFVATMGLVGLLTPSRTVRLCTVLLMATMHGVIAISIAWSNPSGTGSGTYAVLAGLGYYLAWRRTDEGV